MNANKYGILSLIAGVIFFFGTYFLRYDTTGTVVSAGWMGVLLTLLYGGLLWIGLFFLIIGILMIVL